MNYTLTNTTIMPEKITRQVYQFEDPERVEVVDIAVFDYYSGIQCMEANNISQIVFVENMSINHGFIVCCGKVIVRVKTTDYPEIQRIRGRI
jgi:hypothetical protein